MTTDPSPEPDERLIAGRYRLAGVIGKGGMGTVWRAVDEVLGRPVAVKELRVPGHVEDEERARMCARMLREARAAARIDHPNVVTIFDVAEEDGRPWIVMELVRGPSLAEAVEKDGPLPPGRVAELGLRLLGALEAAHAAGVLHRDVKPANVLLARNGRVVLTDFGVASVEDSATITHTKAIVGSPEYLAPEQVAGEVPGPPADLWSLGVTLYEAAEGRPAYRRTTHAATLAAVATARFPELHNAGPLAPALRALLVRKPAGRADADRVRDRLLDVVEQAGFHPEELRDRVLPGRLRPVTGTRTRHVVHTAAPQKSPQKKLVTPPEGRGSTSDTVTNLRVPRTESFRSKMRRWPRWLSRHWATVLVLCSIASAAAARWLAELGSWAGMYTIVLLGLALSVWMFLPHRRIARAVPGAMLVGVIGGGAMMLTDTNPDLLPVLGVLGGALLLGPLIDGQVVPRLRRGSTAGFSLPVPDGWTCRDDEGGISVTDPDRLVSLTVTVDRGIVMAPEESVRHRELGSIRSAPERPDRFGREDYRRIELTAFPLGGHEAAEWEYVWNGPDGTGYHGKDLVVLTSGGVRYWLTMRCREELWPTADAYYDHARERLQIVS